MYFLGNGSNRIITQKTQTNTISDAAGTGPATLTKQSAAKAWLYGTSAAAVSDSLNISSGTDNGTGDYTYNYTNAMSNTTYAPHFSTIQAELANHNGPTLSASFVRVQVFSRQDSFSALDRDNYITVHGDLA